jgi:hypothetical protein
MQRVFQFAIHRNSDLKKIKKNKEKNNGKEAWEHEQQITSLWGIPPKQYHHVFFQPDAKFYVVSGRAI